MIEAAEDEAAARAVGAGVAGTYRITLASGRSKRSPGRFAACLPFRLADMNASKENYFSGSSNCRGSALLPTKFANLLDGSLVADQIASAESLPSLGITISRFLKTVLFEENVALNSFYIGQFGRMFIGAESYMNDGGYLRGTVAIGRYCSIGRRVTIGAAPHNMAGLSTHSKLWLSDPDNQSEEPDYEAIGARPDKAMEPTIIESDVWIGDGAVILSGVRIGVGAVIGANAVVRSDVEPFAIVAGAPAKTIRHRFSRPVRDALLASQWWEAGYETLSQMPVWDIQRLLDQFHRDGSPPKREYITYRLG